MIVKILGKGGDDIISWVLFKEILTALFNRKYSTLCLHQFQVTEIIEGGASERLSYIFLQKEIVDASSCLLQIS